jgi:hypothetical protein
MAWPVFLADNGISNRHLWLFAIGGGVGYLIASYILSYWRFRHVPGPWPAGISYFWLARLAGSGKQGYILREFGKRYGPLVRTGPNYLTTDDPELLRQMSGGRESYARDPWYQGSRWNPYNDNMFTSIDTATHDRIKAKLAAGYSGRDAPALEQALDDQVEAMVSLIRRKYISRNDTVLPLDLAEKTSFFTLDVISAVAFGEAFGYLRADEDLYSFLSIVRSNWPKISVSNDIPWIRSVLFSPLFLRLLGPRYTDETGLGRIMGFEYNQLNYKSSLTNNLAE